jgi:nitrogen fixation NifU-like protein
MATRSGKSTRPLMGPLPAFDGEAERMGSCGDTVYIQVKLERGIVSEAGFQIDGCAVTLACANAAVALARGRRVADVLRLVTPEAVIEILGGLPEDHEHCARLACNALRGAVEDALLGSGDSWRKLYRT